MNVMDDDLEFAKNEYATYFQRPDVYGLEFIHARFINHQFSRHVHDYFVIGWVEYGLQTFTHRTAKYMTHQSGIIVINPDEPHTGEAGSDSGFVYKALYPSEQLMMNVAESLTGFRHVPYFSSQIIYDELLVDHLQRVHGTLSIRMSNALEAEFAFLNFLELLIARYSQPHKPVLNVGREVSSVHQVRDYLEEHYAKNVSLTALAHHVHFSPYYLARAFSLQLGLPPHAYLESVRIRHAQRLLRTGTRIGEVASLVGYPHQSHFTHRFRRLVGVTPGEFAKQSKITQDE